MTDETSVDADLFYRAYNRRGEGTVLKKKHIRQFRIDFVEASNFVKGMSVLELGCGNGLFLRFLQYLGVSDFVGVDGDSRVLHEIPAPLASHVTIADFDSYLASHAEHRMFDRIVMFDVLEHFAPFDGVKILRNAKNLLSSRGQIIIRVPNMASPFALSIQYNDVTHRAAYTPGSLQQVARAAGLLPVAFRPQANSTWLKDARERAFAACMSCLIVHPPMFWTPSMIAVFRKAD